jgi:hypothetical protein
MIMPDPAPESEQIRQVHALAKQLAASKNPVITDIGIQILGLSRLLLAEILPDDFEHVSRFEQAAGSAQDR